MRILADQDVYQMTTDKLTEWGHDVITARSLDMQKAPDEEILRAAKKARRLLITRDKDFGELLFLKEKDTAGVILLRAGSRIWKKSIVNFNGFFVSRKKMFSGTRLP
jgi:predicted nuclease of predicted toxin-antitoxin system